MTLDADVIRGRCQEIEYALDRLDRIRAGGRDDFLVNPDSQDIACYRLLDRYAPRCVTFVFVMTPHSGP
jgi:hypothetical protein